MAVPMVLAICLVGAGLYFFVLRAMSEFADRQIREGLAAMATEVYDICDGNFTELMQSGRMGDSRAVRIKKALTLGTIEDYAARNHLGYRLLDAAGGGLLMQHIQPALEHRLETMHPTAAFSRIHIDGKPFYFRHFDFKPWHWHFDIVKDTVPYAPLIRRVKTVYYLTGFLLVIGLSMILLMLERLLRRPINQIIAAVRNGQSPDYKGIIELEFLSDNIAGMMQMIEERSRWIEHLYRVAVTFRGEMFLDQIAETMRDTMDLNIIIARVDGRGGAVDPVAFSGITEHGTAHSVAGLPFDTILRDQKPLVVLTDAFKAFPSADCLVGIAADSYIGVPVFDRKGAVIGVINAFGAEKALLDWDMNFIKTAGQMVAAEFELLGKEKEQEQVRRQMFRAQKLESLGLLAGGVAHDFNNLLMGIQGRTALMLADGDFSVSNSRHLREIGEYVKKATGLTRQLLGFARGGKYDVKPLDMNAVLAQSAQMFGRTNKEISIQLSLAPGSGTVEIDRRQIEQVLLNLYVNAGHAMPGGGGLHIGTENVVLQADDCHAHQIEPGPYVKISVTDTGVGMDAVTQEKIFDPFFTTKKMGRGTGLGLASAYGIIKNHNGMILVTSEKGCGATFEIYLPASDKPLQRSVKDEVPIMIGSETVLLVDDETMIIDVGRQMLEKLGYRVLVAQSGREALAVYRANRQHIRLVILDMIMQHMNGGETFDRLKAIDPDVRVLLSSGYSIDGDAQEILNRGCRGFLQKPFNLAELSEKLRKTIETDT